MTDYISYVNEYVYVNDDVHMGVNYASCAHWGSREWHRLYIELYIVFEFVPRDTEESEV